tara:strand:- start:82 stop:351 length:270 start_codon:yes stop_codon:yes gene_type:complete
MNKGHNVVKEIEQGVFDFDRRALFIISQALSIGINHLRKLENRKNPSPKDSEHARPSDRADMEELYNKHFGLFELTKLDLVKGASNDEN